MKSKKSFFSKAIIYNNLTRFWWSFALAGLLLFLLVPLQILNLDVDHFIKYNRTANLMGDCIGFTNLIFSVFSVVVATLVFRYLQTTKSVTTMHAMPYTRLRLYINNVLSGVIIILIPLIINLAIMFFIKGFTKYGVLLELNDIWQWFLISAIISITLYVIAVMVGMFTGSSIAQIVFTYILNFLPIAIVFGVSYLLVGLVYGLKEFSEVAIIDLADFMPITQMIKGDWDELGRLVIINLILIVVSLVVGYFVYKYRNLERAGDVISNGVLKPIFKYGVTTCVMAVGVLYIKYLIEIYSPNIMVYIIFALIGYIIAQMLLIKSFKILKYYKGFIVYAGILVLIGIFIKFDISGFEKRVPEVGDIDAVLIGYYGDVKELDYENTNSSENNGSKILRNVKNIEILTNMHKEIIKNRKIEDDIYNNFNIAYRLKNGKFIVRAYPNFVYEDYAEELNEIYNTVEYKIQNYDIFDYEEEKLEEVTIYNNADTVEISGEDARKMLKLAKERILDENYNKGIENYQVYELIFSFEDNKETEGATTYAERTIVVEDRYYNTSLNKKSYINVSLYVTNDDLELLNYAKQFLSPLKAEEITRIVINYNNKIEDEWIEKIIKEEEQIKEIADNFEKLKRSYSDEYARVYISTIAESHIYIGAFKLDDPIFSKFLND